MAIGLIDWDLVRWKQPIPFNLDLMKIARYQKIKKREVVKMLKTLNMAPYSKIIIRKDFEDFDYPLEIFGNSKVTIGGGVFHEGTYQAMPMEIETLEPDISIYSSMGKFYQTSAYTISMWERMKHSVHFRLSLDGTTLWKDWRQQLGDINLKTKFAGIVHDKDPVHIWGSLQELKKFQQQLNSGGKRLGFKYPLIIKNSSEFLDWISIKKLRYLATSNIYSKVSDRLLVQSLTSPQELIYMIGLDNYRPREFIYEYLPRYYRQIVYAAGKNSRIKLEIDPGFLSKDWLNVIELINEFSDYSYKNKKIDLTLFSFDKKIAKTLLCDAVKSFKFVQENNYELFKEFYECLNPEYHQDGYLINCKGGNKFER